MLDQSVVLITGAIAAGKTYLAKNIARRFGMTHFKTREAIRERLGANKNRELLQELGRSLDGDTNGHWIVEELEKAIEDSSSTAFVVDAVRTPEQVRAIRERFARVTHIHLVASDSVLRERFKIRNNFDVMDTDYDDAKRCVVEQAVNRLADLADGVVDTGWSSPSQTLERSMIIMGDRPYESRLVDVLLGGQFGSEGKGNVAAHVSPEYDVLIRSGGPNAGHSVWEPEGTYVFHHLPSGTRCTKSQIVLAPGAVLYVPHLMKEISDCDLTPVRLAIDPNAMIISEDDKRKEATGLVGTIGSTGQGVGQATARKVLRGLDTDLAKDHFDLRQFIKPTQEVLEQAYSNNRRILVEGTQGSGLSLHHGPYPFCTSRDCSIGGLLSEAGIPPSRVNHVMMICRTYPIRVQSPEGGTSGPMFKEITVEEIHERAGIPLDKLKKTETTSTTKRKRRIGEFDWQLLKQSCHLNGPTDIALTFADYLGIDNAAAKCFDDLNSTARHLIARIEEEVQVPVSLVSKDFGPQAILDRRVWA
jgi:adenylosuccinate synthase